MPIQKIIKVGNSAAVTLPREYFNQLQLKIGNLVLVDFIPEERIFKIDPKPQKRGKMKERSASLTHLTPEFLAWSKKFITDNIELFKELARQ